MVDMVPVRSSNIASVGYDDEASELYVTFASGAVYAYEGVAPGVAEAIREAPSPGKFFYANVRDVYTARRVS